jgi:hypothetical protein
MADPPPVAQHQKARAERAGSTERTEERPAERMNQERHNGQSGCRNGAGGFAKRRREDLSESRLDAGIPKMYQSVNLPITAAPIALRITPGSVIHNGSARFGRTSCAYVPDEPGRTPCARIGSGQRRSVCALVLL